MSWYCVLHGHQIIRYDRELAWECIHCLKKWPLSKDLVSASGVFARKTFAVVERSSQPKTEKICDTPKKHFLPPQQVA
jgi:hypothetical protein